MLVLVDDCRCMEDQGDEDIHLLTSADIAAAPGPPPPARARRRSGLPHVHERERQRAGMTTERTMDDGDDDDAGSLSTCAGRAGLVPGPVRAVRPGGSAGSRGSPTSSATSRPWPSRNST